MALYDVVQSAFVETNGNFQDQIDFTFPQAPSSGNLLLLFSFPDKSNNNIAFPAGWTVDQNSVGDGISGAVASRISDGTETGVLTITHFGNFRQPIAFGVEVEGPFSSVAVSGGSVGNSGAGTGTSLASGSTGVLSADSGIAFSYLAIDSQSGFGSTVTFGDSFAEIEKSSSAASGQSAGAIASRLISSTDEINVTNSHNGSADQIMVGVVAYDATPSGPVVRSPDYSLAGNVTGNSADIKAKFDGSSSTVALEYSINSDYSGSVITSVAATGSDNLVSFSLAGLAANTRYYYRFLDDGEISTGDFEFKTVVVGTQYSYSFAFGSCYDTGTPDTFTRIAARNVDFIQSLGDTPYIDSEDATGATQKTAYFNWLSASSIRALFDNTAYYYMWDDHDFGLNDSTSANPATSVMQSIYRDIFPSHDLEVSDAIYHAYTVGRVRHIVMDLRSERNGSQIISATQMQWVLDEISAVAASNSLQAIILVSTVPWIVASDNDTWSDAPVQRQQIVDHAVSEGADQAMVILGGDAHMLAADDGTNSAYGAGGTGGMPVFHGSPFNNTNSIKGGPYSEGDHIGSQQQYGIITVTDSGSQIDIAYSGYDSSEVEQISYTHSISPQVELSSGVQSNFLTLLRG